MSASISFTDTQKGQVTFSVEHPDDAVRIRSEHGEHALDHYFTHYQVESLVEWFKKNVCPAK